MGRSAILHTRGLSLLLIALAAVENGEGGSTDKIYRDLQSKEGATGFYRKWTLKGVCYFIR